MPSTNPVHGYCTVCGGPINRGQCWSLTRQMNRIHLNPDRCIAVLHPEIVEEFLLENPHEREKFEAPEY